MPSGRFPGQPVEGRPSGHHRGDPVFADLGQAGGQVAPQVGEGQVRTKIGQLHPSAGRAGGDRGPGGEPLESGAHQHVPRIPPLGEGRQHQSGSGQLVGGGQILGRVHGGIGVTSDDCGLDLLHEHALASQLGQGDIGATIPLGVDDHQLGLDTGGRQQCSHPFGLPPGQGRATGG